MGHLSARLNKHSIASKIMGFASRLPLSAKCKVCFVQPNWSANSLWLISPKVNRANRINSFFIFCPFLSAWVCPLLVL